MNTLPQGFFRLPSIIGDPNANPPIPALIPLSKSTWWAGIKSGRFPAPVKLGERCTVWKKEEIFAYIENVGMKK
jgi:prophage regulatory protein